MALRAVFLDAGGTLLAENPSREAIYADVAAQLGRPISAAAMRSAMRRTHGALPRTIGGAFRYSEGWFMVFIERIFGGELGLGREAVEAARTRLFTRFADPRSFVVAAGAYELVGSLRARGVRVGVVSNWSERLDALLHGLGLAPPIEFSVVSAVERCEKPSPEIFRIALARAGVAAGECIHAGNDVANDVEGARAAGIEPMLVSNDAFGAVRDFRVVPDLARLQAALLERIG